MEINIILPCSYRLETAVNERNVPCPISSGFRRRASSVELERWTLWKQKLLYIFKLYLCRYWHLAFENSLLKGVRMIKCEVITINLKNLQSKGTQFVLFNPSWNKLINIPCAAQYAHFTCQYVILLYLAKKVHNTWKKCNASCLLTAFFIAQCIVWILFAVWDSTCLQLIYDDRRNGEKNSSLNWSAMELDKLSECTFIHYGEKIKNPPSFIYIFSSS